MKLNHECLLHGIYAQSKFRRNRFICENCAVKIAISSAPVLLNFGGYLIFRAYHHHHHDLLRHKAAQKIQIKYNGIQLKHMYKLYVHPTTKVDLAPMGRSLFLGG